LSHQEIIYTMFHLGRDNPNAAIDSSLNYYNMVSVSNLVTLISTIIAIEH
jgi:hypothetical protein